MAYFKIDPDLPEHYAVRVVMRNNTAVVRLASWDEPRWVGDKCIARWITDQADRFEAMKATFINWANVDVVLVQHHRGAPPAAEDYDRSTQPYGLPH